MKRLSKQKLFEKAPLFVASTCLICEQKTAFKKKEIGKEQYLPGCTIVIYECTKCKKETMNKPFV